MDLLEKSVITYLLSFYPKGVILSRVEDINTLVEATGYSREDIEQLARESEFLELDLQKDIIYFTDRADYFILLLKEAFRIE